MLKQRDKLSRLEKAKKIVVGQITQKTGRGCKDATVLLFIGIEPQNVDFITSIQKHLTNMPETSQQSETLTERFQDFLRVLQKITE